MAAFKERGIEMKLHKRIAAVLIAGAMIFSSTAVLAEGGPQGGPGGPGGQQQQGQGGPDRQQGGNHGGPKMTDETVDLSAAQDFTCGDLTLHAADGVFTLSKEGRSIVLDGEVSVQTKGTPRGMFTQTVRTVKGAEDEETLTAWMPAVWADSRALVLKRDGSFVPALDMSKALVDYTVQSAANADSVTVIPPLLQWKTQSMPMRAYGSAACGWLHRRRPGTAPSAKAKRTMILLRVNPRNGR